MLEEYASVPTRDGFVLASGVSYADFAIANAVELVTFLHPELLTQFRNLTMITQKVRALPKLKTYLENRPTVGEVMTAAVSHFQKSKNFNPVVNLTKIDCINVS